MTENAAAPAAPSASAQPSAQPAPGAATPVDSAAPIEAQAARPIKPIPPRLPGVFPDDDPFPSPPSGSPDSNRGPDGRFTAGPSPATSESGEHTLEPGGETQPAKFKFAGEEFASQEAAEQNLKSLRGQFKPLQALARSVGGVEKIIPNFTQAAESARGWKAEHDRVKAELDSLRSGRPAAADVPAQDAKATEADVDWEMYAEIKKLATDSGEPWKAEQWLIEQVRSTDRARTEKMLNDRFAPLDAERETKETVAQTETLFESMASYTNADGSSAFPELNDEAGAFEIGRLWASLGLPKKAALTPQGAMAAVALYRMAKGNGSQAKPTQVSPTTSIPAPPAPTDTQSAAGMVEGRPTVASVPGNGNAPSAEAARILAGLRQTRAGSRVTLGFDA